MKQIVISLAFSLLFFSAPGQTFQRHTAETAETFVKRITALDKLPHSVIETNEWDRTKKAIIYFVPGSQEDVIGYLLLPTKGLFYKRILIDSFYAEGGATKIESVFFVNADKDKERELVIKTSWPQDHRAAGADGTIYGTFIYDNPNFLTSQNRLMFYKKLSEKLDGGFEGDQEGKRVKAKYKTDNSIRKALGKMGY